MHHEDAAMAVPRALFESIMREHHGDKFDLGVRRFPGSKFGRTIGNTYQRMKNAWISATSGETLGENQADQTIVKGTTPDDTVAMANKIYVPAQMIKEYGEGLQRLGKDEQGNRKPLARLNLGSQHLEFMTNLLKKYAEHIGTAEMLGDKLKGNDIPIPSSSRLAGMYDLNGELREEFNKEQEAKASEIGFGRRVDPSKFHPIIQKMLPDIEQKISNATDMGGFNVRALHGRMLDQLYLRASLHLDPNIINIPDEDKTWNWARSEAKAYGDRSADQNAHYYRAIRGRLLHDINEKNGPEAMQQIALAIPGELSSLREN